MAQARGIKPVGYFDCPGGGQVVVSGRTAYIAHMKAPHGTVSYTHLTLPTIYSV